MPTRRAARDRGLGRLRRHGRWTFEQDGPCVAITYDWRIRADKPLLRRLSWLLKPIFEANHRWAMARAKRASVARSPAPSRQGSRFAASIIA